MKIKVQLSGSEKTLTIATVWSLLLTFLTLVFVGALIYKITPANIAMKIPAPNLPNGQREVMVRAVATTGNHDVLYVGKTNAVIENGMLSATWDPPAEYAGVGYIVEVCTNAVNSLSDNCYSAEQGTLKTGTGKVAGKSTTTETLTSCPYYVSETRTHKLAHLLGLSSVDLQSKVYCGQSTTTNSDEFTTFSKIDVIKATDPTGMSYPDGVLVAKDGTLSTLSYDQLFKLLGDEDQTAPVVQPDTSGTDSQTLSLSGNLLSISGGNSVDITPAPLALASTTSTGLLSSTDWNTFAGKENSLTFDSSFVRTGDSISLMSCAANEVIKSDGVSWLCAQDLVGAGSTTYSAGTGLSLVGTTFNNTGVLDVNATGALAASAGQNPAITLATSTEFTQLASQLALSTTGVSAGTYNNVTVDTKGRVTSGTNISYLTTEQDGVVGNEVAGVVTGGGLVMTGSGTSGDPYKLGLVTTCSSGQIMKWNGSAWACANDTDTDTNTDQQTLSFNPGTGDLSLVNGGTVNLSSINTDGQTLSVSGSGLLRQLTVSGGNTVGLADSDNQSLSLASNTLSLSSGGSVNLAPYLDNTDSQALSIAGNVISLTNGGSITLPADQNTTYSAGDGLSLAGTVFAINAPTCAGTTKLQWNGSAFVCASDVDTDTDAQTLSWNGGTRTLSILSGNSVVISDTDTTYSAGTGITLTGTTFSLTNDFGSSIDSSEITNGTIAAADLANSGASAGTYGDAGVNVAQLTVNAQGQVTSVSNRALPTANTTTTGVLSSGDWNTFNGKENVLTFSDGLARSTNTVTLMDCAASQILQRNAGDTAWVCANQVVDTNTTYSAGTGISLVGTTFSNSGVLSVGASGALTSSGGQNPAITLATTGDLTQLGSQLGLTTTGVSAGTYNNVTVDAQGRVTNGTNVSYLTSETDGVIGNEVADVVTNGGLVMTGAGTSGNPYKVGMITTCADNQLLKYTAAGGWACASDVDTDTNTDAQTLTWNTGTNNLSISGGNSVNLASLLDNTDSQSLSLGGNTLSLTGGGSVSLAGYLDNTDSQTLSWNGGTRTLSLTGGGSVVISDTDTTYSAGTGITLTGTTFSLTNDFGTSIDSSEITNATIAAADLANSGATAGTYGDTGVNVAQLTVNAQGQVTSVSNRALPTANTTTTGVLSSGDWNTFNGKENVLTFNDGLSRATNTVSLMDCAASEILQRNIGDTAWACATQVVDTNTTYSAGTGITLTGTTFSLTNDFGSSIDSAEITNGTVAAADLANSGATAGTYGDTGVNVTQLTVNAQGQVTSVSNRALPTANTTTSGILSSGDWNTFNGKENVLTFTGNGLFSRAGNTITGIAGTVGGQVLKWNGSAWVAGTDNDTTYTNGNGLSLASTTFSINSPTCAGTTKLQWNGSAFVCSADVDTDTDTTNFNIRANAGASANIASGNTVSFVDGTGTTASRSTNDISFSLTNVGTAGTYGSATSVPVITTDAQGRVTSVTSTPINFPAEVDGVIGNEVTNATANGGLSRSGSGTGGSPYTLGLLTTCTDQQVLKYTLGTTTWGCANDIDTNTTYSAGTGITLTGTTFSLTNDFGASVDSSEITNGTVAAADLANSGATAGTYGDTGINVAQLTVNAQGQVTAVSNRALPTANSTTSGILSSGDWNTFNGKENVLTFNDGLSRSTNTVSLMDCAASEILQRNIGDTAWACATQVVDTNTTYSAGTGITLTGTTFSLTNDFGSSIDSSEITNATIAAADLANSGATAGTYGDTGVNVTQLTVNAQGQVTTVSNRALPTANTTTTGVLSSGDWNTFNGKENVLTFTGNGLFSRAGNTITGLAGTVGGQVLKWNGSAWVAGTDNDTTYTNGNGLSLATGTFSVNSPTCAGTTKLQWNGTAFVCSSDVDTDTDTTNFNIRANAGASANIASGNTISFVDGTGTTASRSTNDVSFSLTNVGTAGTYGSATAVPVITTDAQGRVTGVTSTPINFPAEVDGVVGNEVTSATANGGLTRAGSGTGGSPYTLGLLTTCTDQQVLKYTLGTTTWGCANDTDTNTTYSAGTGITLTGTTFSLTNDFGSSIDSSEITNATIAAADLANSGATAGTYGDSGVNVAQLTVNAQGQVTSVSNRALPTANTTTSGILSSGDWNTFNGKENVLTFNDGLSRATNTVSLMDCAASEILQRNVGDTAWACATQVVDTNTTYSAGTGITLTGTTFSLTNDFGASIDSSEITNATIAAADLANSGATAGTYGDTGVNVAQLTVNAQGQVTAVSNRALPTANTTTSGILSSGDWNTFNGKENVLTFTGNGLFSRTGSTITGLAGTVSGQVIKWNGSAWVAGTDNDTTYTNGNGLSLSTGTFSINSPTCAGTTKLQWNGSAFVCSADVDTDTDTTNFNIRANAGASANIASGNTISFVDGTGTSASRSTNDVSFSLTNVGTAGTYGSATAVPVITTDAQGRITGVTNTAINFPAEVDGVIGNEVTAATANGGLTRAGSGTGGSPYTLGLLTTCTDQQVLKYTLGTTTWGCANDTDTNTTYTNGTGLSLVGTTFSLTNDFGSSIDSSEITNATIAAADLANSGATAGTYGDSGVNVTQLTVNAQGQVTAVSNRALPTANTTTTGVLSSGDWNTFNGKENVLTFSDGLSRATNNVTLMDCAASEILQRNVGDTAWACANQVVDTNTTYSAGTGITLTGTTFSLTNDFGSSIDSSEITNATIAAADLANSGATAGTYGDSGVNVAQLTVNAQGQVTSVSNRALPTANTTTTGVLSSGDWNTFNGKENVLTFTGNGLFSRTGNTITGLAGTVSGQVIKWNGSAWVAGTDNDTTYTNGNGLSLSTGTFSINSPTCAGTTKLQWNGSAFSCAVDVDTDTDTTNFNIRANAGASANIASGNTVSFVDGTGTTASRSTNDISFNLSNVGTAGTYGNATTVPVITTDAQGRITSVVSTAITFPAETDGVIGNEVTTATTNGGLTRSGSGTGVSPYTLGLLTTCTDQQVLKYTLGTTTWGCANDTDTNTTYTNGTGLSLVGTTFSLTNDFGSSIDSSEITNATIAAADLANSGATAGTYGDSAVNVAQLTVNAQGQVTSVSNRALPTANTTTTGVLSSGDWNTFSGKENVLTFTGNGLFSRAANTVTGLACTGSQIAKWNGTSFACGTDVDTNTTYTNGTGITLVGTTFSLTNDFGSSIDSSEITNATIAAGDLANSGATAGTYGDTGVNIAQLTVNAQGQVTSVSNRALPTANTTTTGVLSSGDWNTFNGKENVLTFNGPLSRSTNTISLTACGSGQVYQYNGSSWVCTTPGGTTYSAGAGLTLTSTTFSVDCTTTPVAFCNGGDTFGAASVLGTNDANSLSFETNNATAATFSSTGEFLLKDPSNNAISFQVQNSTAVPLFTVDTANNQLLVGSSTTDATAIQLVLDSYNTSTDPSGTNGAMYYNSALAKFRCYQNSMWNDCGNGFNTLTKAADQIATANSTVFQNDNTLVFAASANTTYVFDAWIPVNDSNTGADLKYTFTTPTGSTQNILTSYYASATTFTQCNIITSGQTCANTTVNRADHFIQVKGHVTVAGTAGNVQFQFAQNTATAAVSSPIIKKGATLSWHRSN